MLIEAMTYRIGAHSTSDDDTKYRTAQSPRASPPPPNPGPRPGPHFNNQAAASEAALDMECAAPDESERSYWQERARPRLGWGGLLGGGASITSVTAANTT